MKHLSKILHEFLGLLHQYSIGFETLDHETVSVDAGTSSDKVPILVDILIEIILFFLSLKLHFEFK